MKIQNIPVALIKPYGKNAKKHPEDQIAKVAESIQQFGFKQPLVIDKDNVVVIGHARLLASIKLGLKEVPCIKADDLTVDQVRRLRVIDNKTNESEWDIDMLLTDFSEDELEIFGFDDDLFPVKPQPKDDELPEVPIKPRSKLGDLYELGQHRLLCGDSTKEGDIERLMNGKRASMCFCDPPYNINYTGGMGTHKKNARAGIKNDHMTRIAFAQFLLKAMQPIVANTDGGVYVCMSSSELGSLREAFEKAGGHWQSFIIWVKDNFTLSRSDYQNTYEPILYGWREGVKNHFFTNRRDIANVWEDLDKVKTEYDGTFTTICFQGFKIKLKGKIEQGQVIRKKQFMDIWRYDKPTKSELHPTQKPVALVVEAIVNSSKREDIVLDTFLGSGTTLIASEKTKRICYGVELSEAYIDVIVERWCLMTNTRTIKLNGKQTIWKSPT